MKVVLRKFFKAWRTGSDHFIRFHFSVYIYIIVQCWQRKQEGKKKNIMFNRFVWNWLSDVQRCWCAFEDDRETRMLCYGECNAGDSFCFPSKYNALENLRDRKTFSSRYSWFGATYRTASFAVKLFARFEFLFCHFVDEDSCFVLWQPLSFCNRTRGWSRTTEDSISWIGNRITV